MLLVGKHKARCQEHMSGHRQTSETIFLDVRGEQSSDVSQQDEKTKLVPPGLSKALHIELHIKTDRADVSVVIGAFKMSGAS